MFKNLIATLNFVLFFLICLKIIAILFENLLDYVLKQSQLKNMFEISFTVWLENDGFQSQWNSFFFSILISAIEIHLAPQIFLQYNRLSFHAKSYWLFAHINTICDSVAEVSEPKNHTQKISWKNFFFKETEKKNI